MDKVTYTTIDGQETRYQGKSERQAVKVARQYPDATVTMHVQSGTYKSITQIHPTVGNTYSN